MRASSLLQAASKSEKDEDPGDGDGTGSPPENSGKLLVDATCTPADIRYPNDLGLLNEAREKSESYIDQLHKWAIQNKYPVLKKPRTYRQKARKQYLSVAKQKESWSEKSAKQSVSN